MKKIFLLLGTGFFLSTFSVMGQEQKEEKKELKKVEVSKSEKHKLKANKKVKVESSKSVNRKEAKPKYVRRQAETVQEEKREK